MSKEIGTEISVKQVDFSLLNKMQIEGVFAQDNKKDTLAYIGAIEVRITDWFFLKDSSTLHYAKLKDATIHLNRVDSVWNYQHIVDYFDSPSTGKKKKKSALKLDLENIEIENFTLNQKDGWIGQNQIISVKKLDLLAKHIDLENSKFFIDKIHLVEPLFKQYDYEGLRDKLGLTKKTYVAKKPEDKLRWNNSGLYLLAKELIIENGSFISNKDTDVANKSSLFDGEHIAFQKITGRVLNAEFIDDTLKANIDLATTEQCGFTVNKIAADFKFTPVEMSFANLDLKTPHSKLYDFYAMRYDSFNVDMARFIHKVRLEGNFKKGSIIHSNDIAYFAPALKTWNRKVEIVGKATGTVDNLSTRDMYLHSNNSTIEGDLALRGLPDIGSTFIQFKGKNVQTNYAEIAAIIPSLQKINPPRLDKLTSINFKGNFLGFIDDFVTSGSLQTNLGNAQADINLKLPSGKTPIYSGKIKTDNFNLGVFLDNTNVGIVSVDGKIVGEGFDSRTVKNEFEGKIQSAQIAGYNYKNIELKGSLKNQKFEAIVTANDENLRLDKVEIGMNYKNANKIYAVKGAIEKINLKKLGLTAEDFEGYGKVNVDFSGSNIDNFAGTARIDDAFFSHRGKKMSLDNFSLQSSVEDGKKKLSFSTTEADGYILGKFNIQQIPNAVASLLHKYAPSYFKQPKQKLVDENFSFFLKTKVVDDFVHILDPKLSGFNYSTFTGDLRMPGNQVSLIAEIPNFAYDGKTFSDTKVNATGTGDTLFTNITVANTKISDSFNLPLSRLNLVTVNDITDISLQTSASKTLSDADLNAKIQTLPDGVKIKFFPSSVIINDKKWNLEQDGELNITKDFVDASKITFSQGDQQIVFATAENEVTGKADLLATLTNVNISDFTPLIKGIPRIEGILTGETRVQNPFKNQIITFEGSAKDFAFENKRVGIVELNANSSILTGVTRFSAKTDEKTFKFDIDGVYHAKDSFENKLEVRLVSERLDLSILEPYLNSIVSDLKGDGQSNLKVVLGKNGNTLQGDVLVKEASFRVKYTQCDYKISNETLQFLPNEIGLGSIILKDAFNNPARATGSIRHDFFDNFSFDNIALTTDRMLLLNTTKFDNGQFYGRIIGKANLRINGPENDIKMSISGEPSRVAKDSNHIYIPSEESKETGDVNYIEFIQYGTRIEDLKNTKKSTNVTVNMALKANEDCAIDVILDEETGDIIKGRGNGLLNIVAGTSENLDIRGTYTITKGEYRFNFQTVIGKFFEVENGSTLTWNGNPYDAQINIIADYLATRVDVGAISNSSRVQQRQNLTIKSTLKGVLQKPEISFDFIPQPDSELSKDIIAKKKLEEFKNDPNEMNKQVVSLLLFNSFVVNGQNFLSTSNILNAGFSTIGGMVSDLLTSSLNRELDKATKGKLTTYVDVNANLDLNQTVRQFQASVNGGLKVLLSSRLVLLLGASVDYNNPYAQLNRRSLITPDISIQWLVNKSGSVRVVGFNRSNTNFATGQQNKTGVSLTYRKEYDRFWDLFKSKNKIK